MSNKFDSVTIAEAHMAEIMDLCKRIPAACMAMEEAEGATWPVCGSFGYVTIQLRDAAQHLAAYMPNETETPASAVEPEPAKETRASYGDVAAAVGVACANNKAAKIRAAILAAELPDMRANIRALDRKDIAAAIRELFRDMGLRGISVKTPRYSMASTVAITVPKFEYLDQQVNDFVKGQRRLAAQAVSDKLTSIILAAFPDLDDRSDTISDYFNNPLDVTA